MQCPRLAHPILNFAALKQQNMEIKEFITGSSEENGIGNRDIAVFAIGTGAITATKRASRNKLLQKHVAFFQCDNEPLGCGRNETIGRQTAEECLLKETVLAHNSFHKAIVICTLDGGTGTGAAPVFAKYLYEKGLEVTNIVTLPFSFEGKNRKSISLAAVNEMSNYAKTTIVINEDIYQTLFKDEGVTDYFDAIDSHIENAISFATSLYPQKAPWYRRIFRTKTDKRR